MQYKKRKNKKKEGKKWWFYLLLYSVIMWVLYTIRYIFAVTNKPKDSKPKDDYPPNDDTILIPDDTGSKPDDSIGIIKPDDPINRTDPVLVVTLPIENHKDGEHDYLYNPDKVGQIDISEEPYFTSRTADCGCN